MTKQEFKDFCDIEFLKYGFKPYKSIYYLKGKDILCSIYVQKSMANAFYVNYYFFLDYCEEKKKYPSRKDADLDMRIAVLSKDTYEGEYFMDACIEFELYTKEEIKKYFDKEFEEHIMPIVKQGKERIIQDWDYFADEMFEEEIQKVLSKLSK